MDSIDPATVTALRLAASRLAFHEAVFHQRLHRALGALPGVPDDPRIATLIGESILRAALFEDSAGVAVALLQKAGGDLYRAGMPESSFQALAHPLLRALSEAYPADWSSTASSTWISFFFWVRPQWSLGASLAAQELQTAVSETGPATDGPGPDATTGDVDEDDDDLDDDDEPAGYGNIMLSMTRGNRKK